MPGNFLQADTSFPELSQYDSTEAKLDAIQNYLFLLLENLRYTLRNLSMEDNFNQADLSKWVDGLDIEANTVVSNTVITNELYADYGAIADLVVNELRTDYKKAKRYRQGNTAAIDFIHIHDEELCFLTGTVKRDANDVPLTEQLHNGDRYFWWRDDTYTQMTSLEDTGLPVTVFQYDELVKARFHFETVTLSGGGTARIPVLIFGAGFSAQDDPTGTRSKARMFKDETSMNLVYRTGGGVDTGVYMNDDGFTDVTQRRSSVAVDTSQHTITVTPEGSSAGPVVIEYTEDASGNLTLQWPDAKTFTVSVT